MQILYGVHIELQRFQVEKFVIFQIVQLNLGRNGVEAINCVLERAGEAKRKKKFEKNVRGIVRKIASVWCVLFKFLLESCGWC